VSVEFSCSGGVCALLIGMGERVPRQAPLHIHTEDPTEHRNFVLKV
jgi:hypothetical protein